MSDKASFDDLVTASANASFLVESYCISEVKSAMQGGRKVRPLDAGLQESFSSSALNLVLADKCYCCGCVLEDVTNMLFASAADGHVSEDELYELTDQLGVMPDDVKLCIDVLISELEQGESEDGQN